MSGTKDKWNENINITRECRSNPRIFFQEYTIHYKLGNVLFRFAWIGSFRFIFSFYLCLDSPIDMYNRENFLWNYSSFLLHFGNNSVLFFFVAYAAAPQRFKFQYFHFTSMFSWNRQTKNLKLNEFNALLFLIPVITMAITTKKDELNILKDSFNFIAYKLHRVFILLKFSSV